MRLDHLLSKELRPSGLRLLSGHPATFAEARTQCQPRGATPWNPRGQFRWGVLQKMDASSVEHWLFGLWVSS